MKVLVAGIDGYIGWPLAQFLTLRGHQIVGVDSFFRRRWVEEMGSWSATPVASMSHRLVAFTNATHKNIAFHQGDLTDYPFIKQVIGAYLPDAIIHLGECPSAPYSMIGARHAALVQTNNIVSTLNLIHALRDLQCHAHIVKLGTMGEYGTPNIDIPEGSFEVEFRGRKDYLPFPRLAGSWYHWSKVHDSNNLLFACKTYSLRVTDIMQGIVFGTRFENCIEDDLLVTRLDFDEAFGTIINRLCCQAVVRHPLTVFGSGKQKRGFLPLRDSLKCLAIAIENPPGAGEYRVFNQFEGVHELLQISKTIQRLANLLGFEVSIAHVENPRLEDEEHYYNPDRNHLVALGYKPTHDFELDLRLMLSDLLRFRDRIEARRHVIIPSVKWASGLGRVSASE
ncbi:MAG: NAD-dependent epimerase/dehydratase family protein [Acidobacteriaceae bacterium]|nr:NAD-dependent epimerase/dehydratase family protein [Acidobacteriaceae bacterium]